MADTRRPATPVVVALGADVVALVAFAALGSARHKTGSDVVDIAAPFLIGAAIGWFIARGWRSPHSLRTGVHVWWATVVVGMILRSKAWERGVQTSFVVVATLFTGLFLVGWRLLVRRFGPNTP